MRCSPSAATAPCSAAPGCSTAARSPILGVNLGRVGFLTTADPRRLVPALDALVSGRYVLERRLALIASIISDAGGSSERTDGAQRRRGPQGRRRPGHPGPGQVDGEESDRTAPTGSSSPRPPVDRLLASAGGPIVVPGRRGHGRHAGLRPYPRRAPARGAGRLGRSCIEPIAPGPMTCFVSYDGQVGAMLALGERVYVRRAPSAAVCWSARAPKATSPGCGRSWTGEISPSGRSIR